MPIYVFRCSKCGHEFEQVGRMSDTATPVCEKCSGTTERLISPCTFALMGGGWANEGYSRSTKGTEK